MDRQIDGGMGGRANELMNDPLAVTFLNLCYWYLFSLKLPQKISVILHDDRFL